jgi:hypothetical protein
MTTAANPFLDDAPQESLAQVERLWSVTTLIRNGLPTGEGLIRWGLNLVAAASLDKRATIDAMVKDEGREATIKWLAGERDRAGHKARTRGTDIHAIAEKRSLGLDPGPVPAELVPYVEQLERWERKWKPKPLMAEAPVYNVEHRYAGTLDGIWEVGGRRVVIDYKTTDKGPDAYSRPPYPEVALQLCAYRRAQWVGVLSEQRYASGKRYYLFDPTVAHEPMPEVDGALCVVISPYDCFAVAVRTGEEVWRAFLAVQAAAAWELGGNQEAFGAVLDALEPEGE